jgi:16S rRNA processing protein RimM
VLPALPTTSASRSKLLTERLEVARIAKAHGLKGDVVVAPISNRPERFSVGSTLFDAHDRAYVITASRKQSEKYVVRLDVIGTREIAESLRGTLLFGDPLGELPEGEMWLHELVGSRCRLVDGTECGVVDTVLENPAHDILSLSTGVLVPMVFVVDHDREARIVTINPPDGLLELFE